MKKSRIFMAIILVVLFVFTASAIELDVTETVTSETAALAADDLGELVFSVDFENMTSVTTDGVISFDEVETGVVTSVRYVDRNGEQTPEIQRRDGRAFIKIPYSENIGGVLIYLYRK